MVATVPSASAKSGAATASTWPWSKASWATTSQATAAPGASSAASSARTRRLASAGSRPRARMASRFDPARHVAQRQPVRGGVDRVGLDLGARHELARGGRRRVDVLQRRRRGAHDDDPPAHARGIDAAVDEVGERDGVDGAGRAAEVDPGAAVVEGARRRRVTDAARGGHRQRLEAAGRRRRSAAARRPGRPAGCWRRRGRRGAARCSSPPSTLLWPCSSVSAVASTTLRARPTASISALSSRGVVCSVNWTS